jgi:hypothetical protein
MISFVLNPRLDVEAQLTQWSVYELGPSGGFFQPTGRTSSPTCLETQSI